MCMSFPAINTNEFVEQQTHSQMPSIIMESLHQNIAIHRANSPMIMKLTLVIILACFLSSHIDATLQVGFYRDRCPFAEAIIKDEVKKSYLKDEGIAAGIIRLHFHDCFVRGCDGSVLIDSTSTNQAEKDGPPNKYTLRGFEVIDNAKSRIEGVCKGVVSCADIISYAARDSNVLAGGLHWDVPAGRRDGRISRASENVDIPVQSFNLDQITEFFRKKGLTQGDMVALSGSHSIGRAHCFSITDRLYNFNTKTMQDPKLDPHYAQVLRIVCPRVLQGILNQTLVVGMNQSPFLMDSSYYGNLFKHAGLFNSDQALLDSQVTAGQAEIYAVNDLAWKMDFVQAMIKMSQIEVLTGDQGEIRANCRVINP